MREQIKNEESLLKADSRTLHSRGQPPLKKCQQLKWQQLQKGNLVLILYAFFMSNIKKCNILIASNTEDKIH